MKQTPCSSLKTQGLNDCIAISLRTSINTTGDGYSTVNRLLTIQ